MYSTKATTFDQLRACSDYVGKPNVIELGGYEMPRLLGDSTSNPERYYLYAIPLGIQGHFLIGAHYGTEPYEYLSGEVFRHDTGDHIVAHHPALLVAIARYLLLRVRYLEAEQAEQYATEQAGIAAMPEPPPF